MDRQNDPYGRYLLAMLVGWLLLSVYVSGSFPFLGPDEPRYSQVARQMFESGDWITPRLGTNPWFEKPVLFYWLVCGSFSVFGVHEWVARLPSILASLVVSYLIFAAVSHASSRRQGLLASFLWMTSLFFFAFAHAATFDMLLTASVASALYFFLRFERDRKSKFLYGMYISCGLGILAKGFVAPILIGLPILSYLLWSRNWKEILDLKPLIGVLITVAVAGIWFVPVSIANGSRFWNEFVYEHHFVRYTSSHFHTSGGFFYYIPVLLLGTYPWTLAPLLGNHANSEPQLQLKRFCLCWLITILLFFSFSGSKLPGYILPAAPAFIILSSFPLSEFLDGGKKGRYWLILISALNFLVVATLLLTFPRYAPEFRKLWLMIGIIVLGVMISAIFYFMRKYAASLAAYAAIMFAATLLFIHAFFPQSGWNETRELARRADPYLTAGKKLLLYNIYDFGMVFYTNAHVELNPLGYFIDIRTAPQLYEYVRQNKDAVVMVGNEELPWIREFKLWRVHNIAQGQENSILELESVK